MSEREGAAVEIELEEVGPARDGALTRPSLILGRQLSLKKKKHVNIHVSIAPPDEEGAFTRNSATHRSLPLQRRARDDSPVRVRRASSVTDLGNRYEQWEDLTTNFGDLRQSSRPLEDRVARHYQTLSRRPQYTRRNVWRHFINVQWPKLKSRLRVVFGYELWDSHLKEVEGNFGSGVVSYFIFLRWLFLMNLIIFLMWFGLVVIPQLVWVAGTNAPRTPSQLSCVFPANVSEQRACPRDGPLMVCVGGQLEEAAEQFKVKECEFERENGTLVAHREGPDDVEVASCNVTSGDDVKQYYLCVNGIDPVTPWYQHIFDFVQGQGIFNDTILFHGRYTNETVEVSGNAKYNLPLAYIFLTAAVFIISVILLVYKMGQAYNEAYIQLGGRQRINYCNKLFSSWEFSVTDETTAKLKKAQIQRDFEEEIADLKKREKKRNLQEWALVIISRTFTNLFVLFILVGAAFCIFYAAQFGLDSQLSGDTSSLQLEGFVLPIVFTVFNIVLPVLFSFLARFERFKTQKGEIRMTLVRAILVRLSSLFVLFVTLLVLISCSQSFDGRNMADEEEVVVDEGTCQFSVPDVSTIPGVGNVTTPRENCPQCWETFVGQELYKLGLVNFLFSSITTLSVETTRNYLSRLHWKTFSERLGKGNFNISKSILDLIYTQALLWLGFFYSPFLPLVILFTSFILFYVKKYSLMWNLVPSERGTFKATRTNFLFLFLMLIVLLASLVPIGYTVARLHPSQSCGPFRGKELIYDVVTDLLEQASCRVQQVFDYVQSVSFLVPVIIVLLLVCYAQWVVLRARTRRFNLLKQQLVLEAADATFYGQQLHQARRRGEAVGTGDQIDGGGRDSLVPLQQRVANRVSLTEEVPVQREKRHSGPPRPSSETSAT